MGRQPPFWPLGTWRCKNSRKEAFVRLEIHFFVSRTLQSIRNESLDERDVLVGFGSNVPHAPSPWARWQPVTLRYQDHTDTHQTIEPNGYRVLYGVCSTYWAQGVAGGMQYADEALGSTINS